MKIIAIFLTVFFIASSNASVDVTRLSEALCEYAKNDDRTSIRKKLRSAGLELRDVYTAFVCQPDGKFNGGTLLKTAAFYGAEDVSGFLIKKISKEDLAYKEHDGKTTAEWVKDAITSGNVNDVAKTKAISLEINGRLGE